MYDATLASVPWPAPAYFVSIAFSLHVFYRLKESLSYEELSLII